MLSYSVFALIGLAMVGDGKALDVVSGAVFLVLAVVIMVRTWLGLCIVETADGVQLRTFTRWPSYGWSEIASFGVTAAQVGLYRRSVLVVNLSDKRWRIFRDLNGSPRREDLDDACKYLNARLRGQ